MRKYLHLFLKGSLITYKALMIKVFTLACMMLAGLNFARSQDLKITAIDSSRFPEIKLSVVYTGKKKFDKADLKLSQLQQPVEFSISESAPGSAPEKGRSLFFMIESSGNTYGKALKDLREGLSASIDNLDAEDLLNIAWFGSDEADSSGGGLHLLAESFSSRHERFKSEMMTKISSRADTSHRVDLYKNILEALKYLEAQQSLPRNRLFVVLSTGKNNSRSAISSSDCVNKAKDLGIPVYAVTYLPSDTAYAAGMMMNRVCIRTGGKNIHARSQVEIINALSDFFSTPFPAYLDEAAYDIVFTVQPENGINKATIELDFRGARQFITASDGSNENLIPDDYKAYLWISIGILGLIVVIMILVNVLSGKGKKKQVAAGDEEPQLAPALNKSETDVKKVERKDIVLPKPPASAPVPGEPMVLVSIGGRTLTFQLNKPEVSIGRNESNDIQLSEQTVTGKHAIIHLRGKEINITDLGSTNGTFVNGERIRNKQIVHGDKIRLGKVELTLKV
jgi:hypothetical protein